MYNVRGNQNGTITSTIPLDNSQLEYTALGYYICNGTFAQTSDAHKLRHALKACVWCLHRLTCTCDTTYSHWAKHMQYKLIHSPEGAKVSNQNTDHVINEVKRRSFGLYPSEAFRVVQRLTLPDFY